MKVKSVLFYAVKVLNISMTVFAAFLCLAVGYIFYCNIVKMPVPTLGPLKLYVVLSDSMVPFVKTNDGIITVKTGADKLKTGDVITFLSFESDTTITHRITKISKTGDFYEFNTKGDNNNVEDSFITPESRIIGKVAARLGGFGLIISNIQEAPILIIFPVFLFTTLQFLLNLLQEKLKPPKKKRDGKEYPVENCYTNTHKYI